MALVDITGNIYGDLTVSGFSHKEFRNSRQGYYNFWKCKCICGNESIVLGNNLKSGTTKSCGCKSSRFSLKEKVTTHGLSNTKTYNSWRAMKDRCYCKSHSEYKRYGEIGITVCERWKNSYENFLKDMGERPENHSLDRINPFGNYSPENCRWATYKEQANNTKIKYLAKEIVVLKETGVESI
jgi:hypothetical protein